MDPTIKVIKFGGSCLQNPKAVFEAAKKISTEFKRGTRIVVVVSAISGVTDQLLEAAKKATSNKISKEDIDDVLSMGERISIRLMTSALRSLEIEALALDPDSDLWPILTNSDFGHAEIEIKKTEYLVKRKIKPLLNNRIIPVIAGFLGLSPEKKITTLGRGGSDITAVVLGSSLEADEVILVKDVEGIMSADPKKVDAPETIESLEAEEAYILASAGAKVLHPRSLKYKINSTVIRVIGFNNEDLSGGTIINGILKKSLKADLHDSPLKMITIVGHDVASKPTIKILLETVTSNAKVLGVTLTSSSLLLYVENPSDFINKLHETIKKKGLAKALHCVDPLAMIVISGYGLESSPGIIDIIVTPIANENINLYGVLTISSSIRVFVPWEKRERSLVLIEETLNRFQKLGGST